MSSTPPPPRPWVSSCEPAVHEGDISRKEAAAGILPSHGISVDITDLDPDHHARPIPVHHLTAPAYQSPLRHHRRQASEHRVVKETLNAESKYTNNETDGRAEHHINQYIIRDEIGRGSFGAVHLAVDQYGQEYAVKEFSKSRLRKRAQSSMLRRPRHERRGIGFNSPLHRHSINDAQNEAEKGNPLYLIKEEIAIMKKLNHPNLVSLIEVLDDPEEDSLYMVLEMCKKGVVMKVGLGELADPYDPEKCRHWFRDLILGIEYLHAQGVVHRDIKPDNLLLTEDDVLKIVDFGVSEMFEKENTEMKTAKSAGSPAFLPPELCVTKHGDISGKAADIWSMGISLYCLRYGRIPFEQTGVLELYEAIRSEEVCLDNTHEPEFCDLLGRLLEKDPKKRITMDEIRVHPWVTKNGKDPLLSREDNCADLVEPPSELEVNHAITAKMQHIITLMKAVRKFKSLVEKKRPLGIQEILSSGKRHLNLDGSMPPPLFQSKSDDTYDRRTVGGVLVSEGIHTRTLNPSIPLVASPESEYPPDLAQEHKYHKAPHDHVKPLESHPETEEEHTVVSNGGGEKGHAHDPLSEAPLYLGIGAGENVSDEMAVAESPTAAEFSIYDTAYREEVERIREAQGREATVFLNRRVDGKGEWKGDENMVRKNTDGEGLMGGGGLKGVLEMVRERKEGGGEGERAEEKDAKGKEEIPSPAGETKPEPQPQQAEKEKEPEPETASLPTSPTQKRKIQHPEPETETETPEEEAKKENKIEEIEKREEEKEFLSKREKGMRRFSEVAAKAVANTKALGGKGGEKVERAVKKVVRSGRSWNVVDGNGNGNGERGDEGVKVIGGGKEEVGGKEGNGNGNGNGSGSGRIAE